MKKFGIFILACLIGQFSIAQLKTDTGDQSKKADKTSKMNKIKKKNGYPVYLNVCPHISGLNGSKDSYDQSLFGFEFGIGFRLVSLSDVIGVRAEINYSMQGSKYNETSYSGKVVLGYANVPVLLRGTSKSGFYGEVGVQPGFLMSAKDKYDGNSDDYKDYTKKVDVAGLLGAGYQKGRYGIGLRVTQGFIDINDPSSDEKDLNIVGSLRATFAF